MTTRIILDALEPRRLLSGYFVDTGWAQRMNTDPVYGPSEKPVGVQADGSLITFDHDHLIGGVRRYAADGTPDLNFRARRTPDVWLNDAALDVADRPVVVYDLRSPGSPNAGYEMRRYTRDGAPDTTFASRGTLRLAPPVADPGNTHVSQIETDRHGRILVTFNSPDGVVLGRVHSRGRIDTTFGDNGYVTVPADKGFYARDVRVLGDGRIFVVLSGGSSVQVIAFDDAGAVNTAWGRQGRFTLPRLFSGYFDYPPETILADAGRVLVAVFRVVPDGPTIPAREPPVGLVAGSIARFLPDGRLDARFGEGGFAALRDRGVSYAQPRKPVIDDQGRIWVADEFHGIARLTPDGHPDASFDFDGYFQGFSYRPYLLPNGEDLISFSSNGEPQRLTPVRSPVQLLDGILRINAPDTGSTISVRQRGSSIAVSVNGGPTQRFSQGAVKSVLARLSDGDDVFYYDSNETLSIDAGDGNDRLELVRGAHSVTAGAGDDTILCGDGKDTVYTGGGNDVVDLGGGQGRVYAWEGTYEDGHTLDVRASPGDSSVSFDLRGLASATVRVDGGHAAVFASALKANIAINSPHAAQVRLAGTRASVFRVDTGSGNDMVEVGNGRANVRTFGGNDTVYVLDGRTTVDAGTGDDSVRGGAGADYLIGGAGNDTLRGNGGDDTLDGGRGSDRLFGNAGADRLYGGAGYDRAARDEADEVDGIELIVDP